RGALAHRPDLLILGPRNPEIPTRDVVVFHQHRPVLAAQLDAPRPARPRGGGAFDAAERAAAELQRRDAGVLGFDAVHALRAPREYLDRHAGKPLQQVHAVDGLVDDDAAAVLGELALPAGVVLAGAVPLHVAARQHHAAEAAGVDGGLHLARRIAESRLED